ncbi:hypothetical protein N0V88_002909 [Collariella sp. IMI 366227]|nr:hypothetical protein N0V88_002909 [Collariella sp. IMI 366227]
MDHSDKIKQNLAIFGLKTLDGFSLQQLCDAVGKNLPMDVSKKRILNIYSMWLHFRLMVIDISAADSFTREIATWYKFLKSLAYDDLLILEVFHDWQRGQFLEDPASSRRLSIAAAELRTVMASSPLKACGFTSKAAKSGGQFGHMHPDRVRMSKDNRTVIELDDDEDEGQIIEVSSDEVWLGGHFPQEDTQAKFSDLSFLTGSNRMAMKNMVEHGPRNCPRNLDPSFDKKPAKNYKCVYCKKSRPDYEPSSYHALSFKKYQAKRKASRSPTPDKYVARKKAHPWDITHPRDERSTRWTQRFGDYADDVVVVNKRNLENGRLSYEDEGYGDVPTPPFATQSPLSPENQKTVIEKTEAALSESGESDDSLLYIGGPVELETLKMILAESAKSDLLLVAGGVERLCSSSVFTLLKPHEENIWVNKGLKRTRNCSSDFFDEIEEDVADGAQQMVVPMVVSMNRDTRVAAEERVVNPCMMAVEPVNSKGEVAMTDAESAMLVGTSCNDLESMMVAAGELRIEAAASGQPPAVGSALEKTRAESVAGPIEGPPCEPGAQEPGVVEALEESQAFTKKNIPFTQHGPREATDVEMTEASPPQPVSGATMDCEMSPVANEASPADLDEHGRSVAAVTQGSVAHHVDGTAMKVDSALSVVDMPPITQTEASAKAVVGAVIDSAMVDVMALLTAELEAAAQGNTQTAVVTQPSPYSPETAVQDDSQEPAVVLESPPAAGDSEDSHDVAVISLVSEEVVITREDEGIQAPYIVTQPSPLSDAQQLSEGLLAVEPSPVMGKLSGTSPRDRL